MREPKYHLYLSHEEVRLIIQVLIDKKNATYDKLIKEVPIKTIGYKFRSFFWKSGSD